MNTIVKMWHPARHLPVAGIKHLGSAPSPIKPGRYAAARWKPGEDKSLNHGASRHLARSLVSSSAPMYALHAGEKAPGLGLYEGCYATTTLWSGGPKSLSKGTQQVPLTPGIAPAATGVSRPSP